MARVLLIYPFFMQRHDTSIFRFPPLGLAYVASSLRKRGHQVEILDCTFLSRDDACTRAVLARAPIVGIYSMITMKNDALRFARLLRKSTGLIVAGGPLPSSDPEAFLDDFDAVVIGEGESSMAEIAEAWGAGAPVGGVPGVLTRGGTVTPRPLHPCLDEIPFPARDLLPNQDYIRHGRRKHGYSITSVMSTRGCPFRCEFCSNVVFGVSYRARSAPNVVDEVEQALSLGYDRIHFADDVFTLNRGRVHAICDEIRRRRLSFSWECLGRVDGMDRELAADMRDAGCRRVFFGIESGSREILKLMDKRITPEKARAAVSTAREAGLMTGAFFILYYPGETDRTVLTTLRFAHTLPLDYLSFTMPYPIPGTRLFERVRDRAVRAWKQKVGMIFDHTLVFDADYSQAKMRFAILKGQVEFEIRRRLGPLAPAARFLVDRPSELILKLMR